MTPLTATIRSASYDEPIIYRLMPTGPVLRALHVLPQAQVFDGYCDFLADDADQEVTPESEFLEFVLDDLDSGVPGDRERLEAMIKGEPELEDYHETLGRG